MLVACVLGLTFFVRHAYYLFSFLPFCLHALPVRGACNGRDAARAQSRRLVEVRTVLKIVVKCPRMVHQFSGLNVSVGGIRDFVA